MPGFDEDRANLKAANQATAKQLDDLVTARDAVRRLEREIEARGRRAETSDPAVDGLTQELTAAGEALQTARDALRGGRAALDTALTEFALAVDPTAEVERWSDETPIALFPLRLETRFKTISSPAGNRRELWVRVYPDDVLVDSFQPEISKAEYAGVAKYWSDRWRAGGETASLKSAWAGLVRRYGSGRAAWLIEQVTPLDPAAEPELQDGEYLLVIRSSGPVPAPEKPAIAEFWEETWNSAGAARGEAMEALVSALGVTRAEKVAATLEPVNLRDPAYRPGPDLQARSVFLELPSRADLNLSLDDWTRGATAWLLPERLVLTGYRDGAEVLRETGNPIPRDLAIGPDPLAGKEGQIGLDGDDLKMPEALGWMVDFEVAVERGMAFRIDLGSGDAFPTFDRLFVLGLRLGSDPQEGAEELGQLFTHHQTSRKGLSLLPQGRPTNNTDTDAAAFAWWDDPDESYAHVFDAPATEGTGWKDRPDGAWLAGMLGIDPAILRRSPNYHFTDQLEARAMNIALWPATLGYYMEQMMEPVFSEPAIRSTRQFFTRFVSGRGTLPAIRIGRQPYGILPTTAWSRASWWQDRRAISRLRGASLPDHRFFSELDGLLGRLYSLWSDFAGNVAHVGEPGPDPQQTLLSILGLHPTSAEFFSRMSQSFTQYRNIAGFVTEEVSNQLDGAAQRYFETGLLALSELGATLEPGVWPDMIEKVFHRDAALLKGEIVSADAAEDRALESSRADGRNYLDWLHQASGQSHDTLRKQEGFENGPPTALLYLMLRHALDLGYVDTALVLRAEALQWDDAQRIAARRDPTFIGVAEPAQAVGENRWAQLYRREPAVTGDPTQMLGDFIPQVIATGDFRLREQRDALERLIGVPTARLERLLVEHLDTLRYRLDAWRQGVQAVQLSLMRDESDSGFASDGIYLGAYGWVENLEADDRTLAPKRLDTDLANIFQRPGDLEIVTDDSNHGHIHAPSLDQAVAAAILRNGHLVNATLDEPELLAVDLSSRRVRLAQRIIEGIRNGQPLGALLGYQLERALHDEEDLFLDRIIDELRLHFPLAGNAMASTRDDSVADVGLVEARNVVDGHALAGHLGEEGVDTSYPYDLGGMPDLSDFSGPGLPTAAQIAGIIDGHVYDMVSIADAVGDLSLAEGVYQVVRGNYDRAAGTLDAFGKGTFPPEPEVTRTPRSGKTLTHRATLHLVGGLPPAGNPRSAGEPALARWVAERVPDPTQIVARVSWSDMDGAAVGSLTPTMAELGLEPIDIFYLIDTGGERGLPEFDELLIDHAEQDVTTPPRADARFELEYFPQGTGALTLFEAAPLFRSLRNVVLGRRALQPTDLTLASEARGGQDATMVVRGDKAQEVTELLADAISALDTFISALDPTVDPAAPDAEAARDDARDHIDAWQRDFAALGRALAPFGLHTASMMTPVEARRARFSAILATIDPIIDRWRAKDGDFDTAMAAYAALPASASDEERHALLIRAARCVSTTVIAPLPSIPDFELQLIDLKDEFDIRRGELEGLRNAARMPGETLKALTDFMVHYRAIDLTPLDLDALRDSALGFAGQLHAAAQAIRDDVVARRDKAIALLAGSTSEAGQKAQEAVQRAVQAILGESFIALSEFTLDEPMREEWALAWPQRGKLLEHLKTSVSGADFPVDEWLQSVARVRETIHAFERASLLGEALEVADELAFEPLQLPYRKGDPWLAMDIPELDANGEPFSLEGDKLLLATHFAAGAAFDPAQADKTYCGLLLDEWTETVPTRTETSGLAFHFDRPDTEAPQSILLVTPPTFEGQWRWQTLVDTLHDTLDFARTRAVEPDPLDTSALATLLPATVSPVTLFPITAALNFSLNNRIHVNLAEQDDE